MQFSTSCFFAFRKVPRDPVADDRVRILRALDILLLCCSGCRRRSGSHQKIKCFYILCSADQDVYPGSRILIFYQKQQQKRGVKKICYRTFYCSNKFHKIENYFSFEVLKKKIWPNFQRVIELFTQKIVTKLSKNGFGIRDPRTGKNLFRILDPRSRGQKGTGSRILDPDPQH